MYAPGHGSVLLEGRHEAAQADLSAVGEEFGNLGDPPDVLLSVLGTEAEVVVQSGPDVVAVEPVRGYAQVDQERFKLEGYRGLARPGQTREPDRAPAEAAHRAQGTTSLHPGYVVRLERHVRARLRKK